ncbi:MAG: hypothetical protein ACI909_000670 [Planctomycetota bacterium]|jgi:hypothetical protein
MSIGQILLSTEFIFAVSIYALLIVVALPFFDKIHKRLAHSFLQWPWDNIGMPFFRAVLMLVFILLAYPIIFAIEDAPAIATLLDVNEMRINYLINCLFLITLLFPLIPVIGCWEELILPVQAIAACIMLFSWLVAELQLSNIHYWPGVYIALSIVVLASLTHWTAQTVSKYMGDAINEKYNVTDSGVLISRALILFLQSPAILLFSAGLGWQLK